MSVACFAFVVNAYYEAESQRPANCNLTWQRHGLTYFSDFQTELRWASKTAIDVLVVDFEPFS